jgi:hypothetical protein
VVSVISVSLAVVYATILFGHVEGSEFSPESFSRRSFSFYEIPLLGIQVTPVKRTAAAAPVEAYLLGQKWVAALPPAAWDLVAGWRGGRRVDPRGASALCNYLDTLDARGNLVWLDWSQTNASMAAVLWPVVARLARERLYEIIPDVMRSAAAAAEDGASLAEWQTRLSRLVAERCVVLGDHYSAQRERAYAARLYELALEFDPDNSRARQLAQ